MLYCTADQLLFFRPKEYGPAIRRTFRLLFPGLRGFFFRKMLPLFQKLFQGTVLFSAIMFVFCNMLVDIAYAILNPKVKLEKG